MQPAEQAQFLTAVSIFTQEQVNKAVEAATAPLLEQIEILREQVSGIPRIEEGDIVELTFSAVMKQLPAPKEIDMSQINRLFEHEREATISTMQILANNMKSIVDKVESIPVPRDGANGKDGANGLNGKDGAHGLDGKDGKNGADGVNGRDGLDGENGIHGINGKDGVDGKDGTHGIDGKNGKDGTDGIDGKDGLDGADGVSAEINYSVVASMINNIIIDAVPQYFDLHPIIDGRDGINGKDGRDGNDGSPGKDGASGVDGTSITLDDIVPLVSAAVDEAVAAIPRPSYIVNSAVDRSGVLKFVFSDGSVVEVGSVVGRDGKDIDPEQVRRQLDEMVAKIPRPADGKDGADGANGKDGANGADGKDGADGAGFEFVDLRHIEGRLYHLVVGNSDGTKEKVFPLIQVGQIQQGMWKEDVAYEHGDCVTLAGSQWCAKVANVGSRPDTGNEDWYLSVKRGRDGRDGKLGPPGPQGEKGKDGQHGRDLTQMGFDGRKY